MHFLQELRTAFADHASQPALEHQSRVFTFGELDALASRCGAWFQESGVGPGERVALCTADKRAFLIGGLGAWYAGGIPLPLNPRYPRAELRHLLADSGARFAVAGAEQWSLIEELRSGLPELRTVAVDAAVLDTPAANLRPVELATLDPSLLIYSSGTTGWPKGVVHTHASLASGLLGLKSCWRMTPQDRVVNVLPLFHVHGLCFAALAPWLAGACVLIEDRFHPSESLKTVGRGTILMAVPTMYYHFLGQPAFVETAKQWTGVRLFTCGSAPIRPDVLPRLEGILGKPVINRYGMTEASVITSLPLDGPWPAGSVGVPVQGIEVRVVSEDGRLCAPSEIGAVQLRGPNLFRDYWRQPEATEQALPSGWFDTGDLGFLAADGFLTLAGRRNELIITKGFNVYPQVVERVLSGCPGVEEVAVVGLPDPLHGERVAAAIVRNKPGLDQRQVASFAAANLVDYQRPVQIAFVEVLPRNAMGKLLRHELVELLQSLAAGKSG
jgi:malonyl-CoA/methylmalonyl-CoA synthetase